MSVEPSDPTDHSQTNDCGTKVDNPLGTIAVEIAAAHKRFNAAISTIVETINKNLEPLRAVGREIEQRIQTIQRGIHEAAEIFEPVFAKLTEARKQSAAAAAIGKSLEQAGWFPHGRIPLSVVSGPDFETAIPAWIDAHAGKDWSSITAISTLDTIDQVAKDTFATAVTLYESGKYNAALRVIFPEIEACAYQAFYRALGISWGKRKRPPTSLHELRDVMRLLWRIGAIGALFDARGIWLPQQEQIIREFCYTEVDRDNVLLGQEHFPNRHAVAHGLVRYDSKKACINGLLIADVMMRGIHAANVVFRESPAEASSLLRHIEEEREKREREERERRLPPKQASASGRDP